MKYRLDLTVALPSYEEAQNLKTILPLLKKSLLDLNISFEILVIDTIDPLDNTKEICLENSACFIQREIGNTYGDAIRTAIKYAQGAHIVFMDADGSHNPELIKQMYAYKNDYDIVLASRYVEGGVTENSFILIFMSHIVNRIYSLVLNLDCKDISNSFKLYRLSQLKNIFLYSNNFDIIQEILVKIKRKNPDLRIKEIPFTFLKRNHGKTKRNLFIFVFSYFFSLIKLRFSK